MINIWKNYFKKENLCRKERPCSLQQKYKNTRKLNLWNLYCRNCTLPTVLESQKDTLCRVIKSLNCKWGNQITHKRMAFSHILFVIMTKTLKAPVRLDEKLAHDTNEHILTSHVSSPFGFHLTSELLTSNGTQV